MKNISIIRIGVLSVMLMGLHNGYGMNVPSEENLSGLFQGIQESCSMLPERESIGFVSSLFSLQDLEFSETDLSLSKIKQDGKNILHYACEQKDIRLARIILKSAGVDIWKLLIDLDSEGNTPLHRAVIHDDSDLVRELIHAAKECPEAVEENGCKAWNYLSLKARWGSTVLHLAATYNCLKVLDVFLEALGENVWELARQKNIVGSTALMLASDKNNIQMIERLLYALGDCRYDLMSLQNTWGSTILHDAVVSGYKEIVQMLIATAKEEGKLKELILLRNNLGSRPFDLVSNNPDILAIKAEVENDYF